MKKLMCKPFNFYANLRLQPKLMLTYVVIISIPMVMLALFFYGKVYNMIVADTIRSEQQKSSKTAPAIEQAIDQVLTDYSAIRSLPFIQEAFATPGCPSFRHLMRSEYLENFQTEVQDILDRGRIDHLKIYVDMEDVEASLLSDATGGIFTSMKDSNNAYWTGIFAGSGITSLFCPSFYLSSQELALYSDTAYITKQSLFINGSLHTAYVAAYYSSGILQEILQNSLTVEGSVAYIINERDSIITTTDKSLTGAYFLSYETIQDSFMSSNNFLLKNVLGEDVYAGMYNIKQPQWYMVVVIPSSPLLFKSKLMMIQYLLLFLACIAAALLIAIRLSRSITRRISMVIKQMEKVRTGPPIPLKEPDAHDEIGNLIDTYNYMSEKMNHLLEERSKAAEELRIAEFNSLQAQINPHFLYNTMDMINWMAVQGRTAEITDAVQSLSKFYKLTLSKKEPISSIGNEIQHISIYIRLQNMRYHDNIDFVMDVPDDLMNYQIPRLTLQPLVENAILHGIMEKEEKKGTIVLTGWQDGGFILLMLSDDGVGMTQEQLEKIRNGQGQSKTGSCIAVYNTNHRLQVLYGEQYGLSYDSSPEQGTEVTILLPARSRQEHFSNNSMIQVSGQESSSSPRQVPPEALLRHSRKDRENTYVLENLHKISNQLPDREPLYILTHHVTEDFPAHTHEYYEMSYCYDGVLINCIDGQELVQSAGDLILVNKKAVQSIKYMGQDGYLVNFCIWPALFENLLSNIVGAHNPLSEFLRGAADGIHNAIYFPLGHTPHLENLLFMSTKAYTRAEFHYTAETGKLLRELFEALSATKEYSLYGVNRQCYEILEYVRKHCLTQPLNKIASDISETPHTLSDYLKKHTGRSLDSLVTEARLKQSVKMLQNPEINIYDIPGQCGFQNADEFRQAFSYGFSSTPEEYRKQFL